ncbi:MAG: BglII/BstYI family type II restriction endonuclease [Planctomycetaceae bacterium]
MRSCYFYCLQASRSGLTSGSYESGLPDWLKWQSLASHPAISTHFEIHEWRHASANLSSDFPAEWNDILELLSQFKLCRSWITVGGGRKSGVAQAIDGFLYERGWIEKQFATSVQVDDLHIESPTHKVDCYKNSVALEVEWNNKDPIF